MPSPDSKPCLHQLLTRVSHLKNKPEDGMGALKPFMVCSDCGAILFLFAPVNDQPQRHRLEAES